MNEGFRTTRWTRVLAARGGEPEAKAALSVLCEVYYGPVFRFVRHAVRDIDSGTARDLTHAFFESVLEGDGIRGVEPGLGRFRSYVLGAVKHFLADRRKWESAEKRGGGKEIGVLDASGIAEANVAPFPDAYFDREWAMALLGRALGRLAEEHEATGKEEQFEALKRWLNGDEVGVSQAKVAAELGGSEGAVKVAIHRLRKRLRAIVRGEIAQTVESEEDVVGELNYLIEALG